MKKIIVIGCPGSGKSTLAIKLAEKLFYPCLHLDKVYHIDNKNHISREQLIEVVNAFDKQNSKWIIDGNYQSTLSQRLKICDTVILLDMPTKLCLKNIHLRTTNEKRPDMSANFDNKILDPAFELSVKNFKKQKLPTIKKLLEESLNKSVIVLKNYLAVDEFLNRV